MSIALVIYRYSLLFALTILTMGLTHASTFVPGFPDESSAHLKEAVAEKEAAAEQEAQNAEDLLRKKAIVIGASSGMGREVAKLLGRAGYRVGLTARRLDLLESLAKEVSRPLVQQIDVTDDQAPEQLRALIKKMGGLDLMVISISAYLDNRSKKSDGSPDWNIGQGNWKEHARTIKVGTVGFAAMAEVAMEHFKKQKHGHLVGISSTSGCRGFASSPDYSAAKAFQSYYMQGLRAQMVRDHHNVDVTDIVPGYVAVEHSPFGEDPQAYWEITCEEAGKQIMAAINKKETVAYVPKKAWLLSWVKLLPDWLFYKYFNHL